LTELIDERQYSYVNISQTDLPVEAGPDGAACCPAELIPPLEAAEAAELAQGFAALADPARLRLFALIAGQEGQVCACSMVEPLGKSQPTVSHHLKVLYEAGLVDRERRGTWVWYWAVPGRLSALTATLGRAVNA